MTTNTPNLALPYPDPADTLATVDDSFKALALALDGSIANPGLAAGAGTFRVSRASGNVSAIIDVTFAAGLAADGTVTTVAASYAPPITIHVSVYNRNTGGMTLLYITPAGVVKTGFAIAAGHRIHDVVGWPE